MELEMDGRTSGDDQFQMHFDYYFGKYLTKDFQMTFGTAPDKATELKQTQ